MGEKLFVNMWTVPFMILDSVGITDLKSLLNFLVANFIEKYASFGYLNPMAIKSTRTFDFGLILVCYRNFHLILQSLENSIDILLKCKYLFVFNN